MEYGTVISTLESPTTREFSFLVRNPRVRRGQFVAVQTDEGLLIGRVADIRKANRYYAQAETVKEYESSGKPLAHIFPVGDWEVLQADVAALGVRGSDGFQDVRFPPSPGNPVSEPDPQVLEEFFGMDAAGIHLGSFAAHDIQVRVNPTRLIQKHLAILAMSGAGKSYLSSILIEELLRRPAEEGLAVVIIDPHGEYASLGSDPALSGKVRVFPVQDVRIGLPGLRQGRIGELLPTLSTSQARELARVMKGMKGSFGMADLLAAVEADQMKQAVKDLLLTALYELEELELFSEADAPGLEDLARQGSVAVIDLSQTTNMRKKQIVTAYLARVLFNARRKETIPPFLLVLEEAHQFCPEREKRDNALSKGIITTIAREGRKFHAALCLISQRPVHLSTTVLSQCGTNIILRITNPYDLDHIEKTSEGITKDMARQISGLRVGSGLIVGEAVNFPLLVRIRKRSTAPGGKNTGLEDAARDYYRRQQQRKKDAKSFM